MTRDEEQCLALGQEVSRMISHLIGSRAYSSRRITFPGGAVEMFLTNSEEISQLFHRAAASGFEVNSVIVTEEPPSRAN